MAKRNNFTAGLAGLLQGVNQGAQQNYANKVAQTELGWKDPNRPLGDEELNRTGLDILGKAYAAQAMYPTLPGTSQQTIDPQAIVKLLQSYRGIVNGSQGAGFSPDTGMPNTATPTMQVQGLPGASTPPGAATPVAPTSVNRAGTLQSVADEMRRRGLFK
jgi:hypothetical protein